MVKGISKQVIVVPSPDPELFEQAIFILKEDAVCRGGITDRRLLWEAKHLLHGEKPTHLWVYGTVCALLGGLLVGVFWLISSLL